MYIIEGTWEIAEEEQVYQLQTDDLIILAAGRHHYGTELSSPNNKHMYIHACEKSLSGKDDSKRDNVTKEDYLKQFDTVIHCQNNPFIRQLFEEVIQISWRKENLKEYKRELLFKLLLCELYHQQSRKDASKESVVQQAVRLIQTNPQIFYKSKDVAEQFYICQRTLNNQFRRIYGKTFYEYQMDKKLEMVKQYLWNVPNARLEEAARNFGFCDEFHLGKAYKKKYNISPKKHLTERLGRK